MFYNSFSFINKMNMDRVCEPNAPNATRRNYYM